LLLQKAKIMKKITLLTILLMSVAGFSQTNRQLIQTYLESNKAKFDLTTQDLSDWSIVSEVPGAGTKITSVYVAQRYHGIEIFNAQFNVAVKDANVINAVGNGLVKNISQKVNTTTPSVSVTQAAQTAYSKLGINIPVTFSIIETGSDHAFKLSDGVQSDVISAKLVYQPTADNKLKLAWSYQFYAPNGHYMDIRIDAVNSNVLDKNDLTVTCSFDAKDKKHSHKPAAFNFNDVLFNSGNASTMVVTPATYRVIPFNYESPNHHGFEVITTTGEAVASPNGWHDINAAIGGTTANLKFTYTRGNNVLAQEDANGDNGTGLRADGGAGLLFDFPDYVPGVGQTLQPTAYTNAAITNLFYMNNIMHDVWYQYGFNEASGNFQRQNYGRGGAATATGDPVQADAQDGWSQTTATLNNANFSAPADGGLPRMQMFMWNAGAPPTNFITVNSPGSIAGPRSATTNVFEGTDRIPVPVAPNGIVSDLVLFQSTPLDPLQNPNSACGPATNAFDIDGKIALIRRGGCFFSNKVKAAQDAGALAVIVTDTVPNNPVRLSMSSTGLLGITIPAVFITKEIGDELIATMATETVNVKLEVPADLYLFADGDFDNGVIAHEYTHGISGRLTGGPTNPNCLTTPEQQGEGWSDWATLMMQLKAGDVGTTPRSIASYCVNQQPEGDGIRNFPYSTDMAVNPITFGASNGTLFDVEFDPGDGIMRVEPHATGEVWCTMLWDLTWAYIEKYGFDADVYAGTGGNNKVMRLVLDAMKLQPCNPSYIQARDAIIAADQATTGGADYCMIWKVFARRGMGVNASSGANTGTTANVAAIHDQVEDFTEPAAGPNCTLAVSHVEKNDMFRVYPNPSNGMYNVRINQFSGKVNFQVVDINGRTVYNYTDENFNIERALNLSSLQSGVYILKVSADNVNYTQKLVKK
jgi:extracellular elastinolytic metalloproteinase